MSLGLSAKLAVPVELRTKERRVFRLSRLVGPEGLELHRPAPFERGEPVDLQLLLPDTPEGGTLLRLRAVVELAGKAAEQGGERGGCALAFVNAPAETRGAILRYVAERLGLPSLGAY